MSDDLRESYPHVRWRDIVGMRNILAHAYFDTDLDVVWEVIAHDIPDLRTQLATLVDELADEDG